MTAKKCIKSLLTCKVVVLLIKPIAFLPLSLLSPSLLLLLWSINFAAMVMWCHTYPLYNIPMVFLATAILGLSPYDKVTMLVNNTMPFLIGLTQIRISDNVCFQKISIPPPPTEDHWKFRGGGGFKGSNFQGVRGVHGKLFSKGWWTTYKTLKATYDRSEVQNHTYVHCFETKVSTPGRWDEVNIIRFNVSVFLWVS